eukprot:6185008-Pyramimonas_sp.AAC.1
MHTSNILEFSCVKHAELPPEFQDKGRVAAQGDMMNDESGLAAAFADAASSASHTEASKLCDAMALLPGNGGGQSDAAVACIQALLYGDG